MAPSLAEVQATISAGVHLLEETRKFGEENAGGNWVSLEDTFIQGLEGDGPLILAMQAAVNAARANLAGVITTARASAIIGAGLSLFCRHVIDKPNITDFQTMIDNLVEYMIDNTIRVQSRVFSFGSPSADAGNTGDGTILRLTKDSRNFDLEAQHSDSKTAYCMQDGNSGRNRHEELFRFRGQAPGPDALQVSGSNADQQIAALSANNSLLRNPSFSSFGGSASSPSAINNWTSSVTVNSTNYAFDGTNYYRDYKGDTTPYSLQMKVAATLTQKIVADAGRSFDRTRPYLLQVAYNRQVNSAAGTLTIGMGSQTNNVVLAAQTGWGLLRSPSTIGQNCWLRNFNEDELDVSITWAPSSGSGDLLIDDVLLVPGTFFDGSWYWVLGGATPFLYGEHDGDFFTWADSETGSILQVWFWRAFGRYLPHTTGSGVNWSDP